MEIEIPLFPLTSVLLPGGVLPLRIFEPRYLSMIGHCMKQDQAFGVVLIEAGSEAGNAAAFFPIGTTARIIDFDQLVDGKLGVTCYGESPFQVVGHRVQDDQLIIARVTFRQLESNHGDDLDQSMVDFVKTQLAKAKPKNHPAISPEDWDDPNWISFRLAELLPLSARDRLTLLEMSTPRRLNTLLDILKGNNLI